MFQAQYDPVDTDFVQEVGLHGDFVKDVAFQVENLDYIVKYAKQQGAVVVKDIWEESDDNGVVRIAVLKTVSILTGYILKKRQQFIKFFI